MISAIFAHNGLQTVMHAIRPFAVSRRLVQTLVKASSSADAVSGKAPSFRPALHQQAAAAASSTVIPGQVHTRSIVTTASVLASTATAGGKLFHNPRSNGRTSMGEAFWIMQHHAMEMIAKLTSDCDKDLDFTYERYLGNCPELVARADKNGGELSQAAVCSYIKKHPEILTKAGFSKGDLVDIDHIWPKCKGGRNHPYNYCLMLAKVNRGFGGRISEEKFWVVGFPAVIKVWQYHLSALRDELESCAIWMTSLLPS